MAIDLQRASIREIQELRFAATPKRIRAMSGETVILDTRDALLVWEPRRVVPAYAVPLRDLSVELVESPSAELPPGLPPVLPPDVHPEWHTVPGAAMVSAAISELGEIGFRPDDSSLGGRIIMRWAPFDWLEEDQRVYSHPHDPFARIDVLRSDRKVRVDVGQTVIAESSRPLALFETGLPVRWYLPREDVRMDLLTPSPTHTICAYKGVASYFSAPGAPDVAWYYPEPLHDAIEVADHLCFWRDAQVIVDGEVTHTGMPGD